MILHQFGTLQREYDHTYYVTEECFTEQDISTQVGSTQWIVHVFTLHYNSFIFFFSSDHPVDEEKLDEGKDDDAASTKGGKKLKAEVGECWYDKY